MKIGTRINPSILREKRIKPIKNELHRPGIYGIVNILNGNMYIGQSLDIYDRKTNHFQTLNTDKHHNAHLQNAYNFYGPSNFKFIVLEFVDNRIMLNEREQYWIDKTPSNYNMIKDVEKGLGQYWADKTDHPDGIYKKDGETFYRPSWHRWVYGGERNPNS